MVLYKHACVAAVSMLLRQVRVQIRNVLQENMKHNFGAFVMSPFVLAHVSEPEKGLGHLLPHNSNRVEAV